MNIEEEVMKQVYRMEELHNKFSTGEWKEMNELYSDEFQGVLYMPKSGKIEEYDAHQIRDGNKMAASYYKDKNIKFTYSGIMIIPQADNQAAVSYSITHQNESNLVKALSLEVWKKESDGIWRLLRWYEEKGKAASYNS